MTNDEGRMPAGFKVVPRAEFFRAIGPQDVTPIPRGKYPYSSHWRTPRGELRGWSREEVYALPE